MNIETGKYYVTRDGRKVRIYATDGGADLPIHGAVLSKLGHWYACIWDKDGLYLPPKTDFAGDIVGPWIERPVIDVPSMPAWCSWAAMDADGEWFAYQNPPAREINGWMGECVPIPWAYTPKWKGDWKESLVKFR